MRPPFLPSRSVPKSPRRVSRTVAGGAAIAVGLGTATASADAPGTPDGAWRASAPSPAVASRRGGRELLVVDPRVAGHADLVRAARREIEVHVLDPREDGVAQVSRLLATRRDVAAVHLVSHGTSGALLFGGTLLTRASLAVHREALAGWFDAAPYARRPDLALYGCDVADGAEGAAFVEALAAATGADVAASTDPTGGVALAADWVLEAAVGRIEARLPIDARAAAAYPGTLDVFVVSNLNSDGPGSLDQALQDANDRAGHDTIVFSTTACGAGCDGGLPDGSATTDGSLVGTIPVSTVLAAFDSVDVVGPGADLLTLDGQGITSMFLAYGQGEYVVDMSIAGLTFEDGSGEWYGGAIEATGEGATIEVEDCVFLDNENVMGAGGAVGAEYGGTIHVARSYFEGNRAVHELYGTGGAVGGWGDAILSVEDSVLVENEATFGGAVGARYGSVVDVVDSSLIDNDASTYGGAAVAFGDGDALSFVNCTIAGNRAGVMSGAIHVGGALTLAHSTVAGNATATGGATGGINFLGISDVGMSLVRDSILHGSRRGDDSTEDLVNLNGAALTVTRALVGASSGALTTTDVITGEDPLLLPLADNGGDAPTMALDPESPAIDVGENPDALAFDQRGAGFPRGVGSAAALGAFEWSPAPPPGPDGGAGGGVGGGSGGGAGGGGGGGSTGGGDDGCGCSVAGAGGSANAPVAASGFALALATWLGLRRRGRRDAAR